MCVCVSGAASDSVAQLRVSPCSEKMSEAATTLANKTPATECWLPWEGWEHRAKTPGTEASSNNLVWEYV